VIYIEQPAAEVEQVRRTRAVVCAGRRIDRGFAALRSPGGIGGRRGGSQGAASLHLETRRTPRSREGRYSDAVHDYARPSRRSPTKASSTSSSPTRCSRRATTTTPAYALRRALELDPTLVDSVVDKHSFYGDPAEFDRQLELLERYLGDHFLDEDARAPPRGELPVRAKPPMAVDLLQSPSSASVTDSRTGLDAPRARRSDRLLRESAK
jgi:hypothetical protein